MPWYRAQDSRQNNWEINSDGVARIVRSFIYHRELIRRSSRVEHPGNSFFLPDIVAYETNFTGLVQEVDREAVRWTREAWVQANLDGDGLLNSLVDLRQQGIRDGELFHRNSLQASSESQRNINSAVDTASTMMSAAIPVRNTAASMLIAGSVIVTGGAATALVAAAGAGLRFTSRIEEGGTVQQAVAETAIDMTVTVVTAGAGSFMATTALANTTRRAVAMAVLGATLNTAADGAKTIVTGEIGRRPLTGLTARIGAEAVNGLVSNLLLRGIPVFRVIPGSSATQVRDAATSAAFGFVGDRVVDAARGTAGSTSPNESVPANTLLQSSPRITSAEAFVRENAMRRA